MNLPLSKCIPAQRTLSIDQVESAVEALNRAAQPEPVEYQRLPGGYFLITRGCAVCAAAALLRKRVVPGVETRRPRLRPWRYIQERGLGGRAFLDVPVVETARGTPQPDANAQRR